MREGWRGKFTAEVLKVTALSLPLLNSFSHAIRYQPQGKLQIFGTLGPTSKRFGGGEHKQEGLCKQNGCICLREARWCKGSICDVLIYLLNQELNILSPICLFLQTPLAALRMPPCCLALCGFSTSLTI